MLPPASAKEEHFEGVNQAPPSPYERRKPVLELLEVRKRIKKTEWQDPEIQKICEAFALSDMLKLFVRRWVSTWRP